MEAQYFKQPGDVAWDRQRGPFARRAFASPFCPLRAPCLGDRIRVEFSPLLGASRATAPWCRKSVGETNYAWITIGAAWRSRIMFWHSS